MATNKTARDTMVIVAVVVAVCVTIFANLLADKKFGRIDLTKEGRYSLSQPFRNILGRLEPTDNGAPSCEITYYVSEKAVPEFAHYRRDMLDKLREIETFSNGKIKVTATDPSSDKDLRERLKKDGCENEIMTYEKDQQHQALVFSVIEMTYRDKPKVQIKWIYEADLLEYELGSRIVAMTLKQKPVIAVMIPPSPPQPPQMGRRPPGSGFEWLREGYFDRDKKFDVRGVDLNENSAIPADAELFIMVRPRNLTERQKYEITRYLAGGGKMLLLASEFKVSYEFAYRIEKTPTGLEDYLKELGVTLGQDFVADNACLKIAFPNPMTGEAEYKRAPIFIRILPENIDQESVLTKLMPNMMVLSPSEIALDSDKLSRNGLVSHVLAKTSPQSWIIPFSEGVNFDKESEYDEEKQTYTGSRNVFVLLEGQFAFPYEGKPVPPWEPNRPPAEKDKEKDKEKKEEPALQKKSGALAIFSGPEAFHELYMTDRQLGQLLQGNIAAISNMAEKFSLGDDLIQLRTKRYETRSIKSLGGAENDWRRFLVKAGLIGGPAVVLFLFATVWFIYRRAKQVRYERKYAATTGPSSFTP